MTTGPAARRALWWLLLANLALVAWVFKPLAIALFTAAVLAGALAPLHHRLMARLGQRSRAAATLLLILVLVVVLAPVVALSAFIVSETASAVRFISETVRNEGLDGLVTRMPDRIEGFVRAGMERLAIREEEELGRTVQEQVSAQGGKAVAAVGAVVVGTGSLLFQSAMLLIALYVFLTQKERILDWIDEVSPLESGQTRELMGEFRRVSVAVVRSTVITAGVQAAVALIGYYIARVPYALFFGAVTFFFAMIPAVGGAVVALFAAGLLLVLGKIGAAIFLAAWALVAVGLSDNLVKPLVIKHDVPLHGAVLFFALLGGLAAFGPIGLVIGPLAVALLVALLRMWRRDYGSPPNKGSSPPRPPEAGSPLPAPARHLPGTLVTQE